MIADSFQATRQQSREAKHDNEHRDRQHRRDRRVLAGHDVCSQYDEVAGDMGSEQPAKPDEPDGVRASSDQAEQSGPQHRACLVVVAGAKR
jgi:hypothetical protein